MGKIENILELEGVQNLESKLKQFNKDELIQVLIDESNRRKSLKEAHHNTLNQKNKLKDDNNKLVKVNERLNVKLENTEKEAKDNEETVIILNHKIKVKQDVINELNKDNTKLTDINLALNATLKEMKNELRINRVLNNMRASDLHKLINSSGNLVNAVQSIINVFDVTQEEVADAEINRKKMEEIKHER